MKKHDVILIPSALAICVSNLADPYTWSRNASDMVVAAPLWQSVAGMTAALVVIVAAVLALRRRQRSAMLLLITEFLLNLTLNIVYVQRDGLMRFSRGFGGEEYLTLYLLALFLRMSLVALLYTKSNCRD